MRPRLLFHCQHLLGVGHLTRSLALARSLVERFDVVFLQGGPDIGRTVASPAFRHVQLTPLLMDEASGRLLDPSGRREPDVILAERAGQIREVLAAGPLAALVTELFPFGRNKFKAEILGMIEEARAVAPGVVVASSVRDILVEKTGGTGRELAMAELARRHFDLVLVHADPALIRFEETFAPAESVADRLRYTGFVTEPDGPGPGEVEHGGSGGSAGNGGTARGRDVLVSLGGGVVGEELGDAVLAAVSGVPDARFRFVVGPHAPAGFQARLQSAQARWGASRVCVESFLPDFERQLSRVGVSISLAGYNTVMNLVRTQTPALVWPHGANREQGLRAERFAALGWLRVLGREDLEPGRLAGLIRKRLDGPGAAPSGPVDLSGAPASARILAAAVAARAERCGG